MTGAGVCQGLYICEPIHASQRQCNFRVREASLLSAQLLYKRNEDSKACRDSKR